MTKTMKQVQLNRYGTPDVLQLVDADVPQPKAGEVVIKVEAIGVNYSDILRRRNQYFQPTPLPYVLGSEAVGRIVSVGENVTEPYATGAMVLAILPFGGGYAEHVAAIALGLIAQGKLKIETPKTFTLQDVSEAHQQIEARQTTGKVVLIP